MPSMAWHLQTFKRAPTKSFTFDGTSGLGATGTTTTVYTTTGRVLVLYIPIITETDLTQTEASSSVSLGTTSQVTRFTGTNTVTALDAGEWFKTGEAVVGSQIMGATQINATVSEDIILDFTGVGDCNGGSLTVYCWYLPLSEDGALE